jgi:hypothetical protein
MGPRTVEQLGGRSSHGSFVRPVCRVAHAAAGSAAGHGPPTRAVARDQVRHQPVGLSALRTGGRVMGRGVDGGVARRCRRSATPVVDVRHAPTRTRGTPRGVDEVSTGVSQIGDTCRRCATRPDEHPPPMREGRPWCRREVSQIGDTCRRCATRPDEHPPPSTADGPEHGVHGGDAGARPRAFDLGRARAAHSSVDGTAVVDLVGTRRRPRLTAMTVLDPMAAAGGPSPVRPGREPAGPAPARRGSGRCRGGLRRRSGRSVGDAPLRAGTRGQRPRLAGCGSATAP